MGFFLEQFEKCEANSDIFLFPNKVSYAQILSLAILKSKSFNKKFVQVDSIEGINWLVDFLLADILSIPLVLGDYKKISFENLGEVNLFTSATSGNPKLISYKWSEIFAYTKSSKSLYGQTWFTSFNMLLYAGLQVLAQVVSSNGKLVLSNYINISSNEVILKKLKNFNINATPSWIKNLLLFCDLKNVSPNRIVLGGEIVSQKLLDLLTSTFSSSKIIHIYATSELGKCFEVTDAKAGIPIEFLKSNFKIENSKLFSKVNGNWIDTYDIVEVSDNRIFFKGRSCDIINVGGQKVSLLEIEKLFENIDEIKDLKVYGIKNHISGEIVAMDIVCEKNNILKIKELIAELSHLKLNKYQRPRIVNFVDRIELNIAGKKKRI